MFAVEEVLLALTCRGSVVCAFTSDFALYLVLFVLAFSEGAIRCGFAFSELLGCAHSPFHRHFVISIDIIVMYAPV